MLKKIILMMAMLVIAGCGSGGDDVPTEKIVAQGAIAPAVLIVPESAGGSINNIRNLSGDQGGLIFELGSQVKELATTKVGDVVMLPGNAGAGIPDGFTGTVQSINGGTYTLVPAAIEDVFDKLKISFNTAESGVTVKSVIAPPGSKILLSSGSEAHQVGVTTSETLTLDMNGKINGKVSISQEFDAGDGTKFKVGAEVNLKDLILSGDLNFDNGKFVSQALNGEQWFYTKLGLQGTYDGKISMTPSVKGGVKMNIADIFRQQKIWNDLKYKTDYFSLEGLNGEAKKGRWAIGGVAFTPAGIVAMTQNNIAIKRSSALSIVLWMYIDSSGSISFEGEMGVRVLPYKLDVGTEFAVAGSNFKSNSWNRSVVADFETPFFDSKLDFSGRMGLSTDLDIFILGIRPASFGAFVGSVVKTGIEGHAAYYPFQNKWAGWACGYLQLKSGIQLYGNMRLKAKLGSGGDSGSWWQKEFSSEYTMQSEDKYMGNYINAFGGDGATCVTSGVIGFTSQEIGPDADPARAKVKIDFSTSWADATLRNQAKTWMLTVGANTPITIPDSSDGTQVISVPRGATTPVKLEAKNAKYGDLGLSVSHDIIVAPGPTINFQTWYSLTDCHEITVVPDVYAPRGIKTIDWTFVDQDGTVSSVNTTGIDTFKKIIQKCGNVTVTGKVTDAKDYWAQASYSMNSNMPPIITQPGQDSIVISPSEVTVGQLATFTITTKVIDLPDSIVMQLPDCTPSPMTAVSGGDVHKRQYSCMPTGVAGNRIGFVKSRPDVTYQENFSVKVNAALPVVSTSKIPHTGITANQCYAAGSDTLISCTSADAIALSGAGKQDGMYATVNPMSYSVVGTYSKEECVKDNVTGLVWEGKTASGTRAGGNGYSNYGDGRSGDASAYANSVNTAVLCGANNWRLPSPQELQSLVNYGVPFQTGSLINVDWFPNFSASSYWVTSPVDGIFRSIYFTFGGIVRESTQVNRNVRLVRF